MDCKKCKSKDISIKNNKLTCNNCNTEWIEPDAIDDQSQTHGEGVLKRRTVNETR